MNYMDAHNRFDISRFIGQLRGKEYLDVLSDLDREIQLAESIRISSKAQDRDAAHVQQKYIFALKGLSFLIGAGGSKPAGLDAQTLHIFQPLVNDLVNAGVFKPDILDQLT